MVHSTEKFINAVAFPINVSCPILSLIEDFKASDEHFNPRKTNNKILHCRPGRPLRPTFNYFTQAHLFVRFFF